MNKFMIDWRVTEQDVKQELVSADNRWHISRTQRGDAPSQFFLSNYELLLTPHGIGADYKECFETFISDCDAFMLKLEQIKAEAQAHMEALLEAEKLAGQPNDERQSD